MGNFDDIPLAGGSGNARAGLFDDIPVRKKSSFKPSLGTKLRIASDIVRPVVDIALEPAKREVAEVASAVFPTFQATTNAAITAQEKGFDPRAIGRSFVRGLPIPRLEEGYGPTITPKEARRPGELITNVARAINPEFEEPTGPVSQFALDLVGGALIGSPTAALERGLSSVGQAYARSEALNAARTLKNLPERVTKLRVREAIQNQPKALPPGPVRKALPPPANIGEGFEIVSPQESARRIESQRKPILEGLKAQPKQLEARAIGETFQLSTTAQAKSKILAPMQKDVSRLNKRINRLIEEEAAALEDMAGNFRGGQVIRPEVGGGYRTSLPDFIKHPGTGNKPVSREQFLDTAKRNLDQGRSAAGIPEEYQELKAASDYLAGKIRRSPLSERGFARLGKSFEGMSEEELRREIARYKGGKKFDPMRVGLQKERGFIQTVREAEKTKPEVARAIQGEYAPITNRETLERAKGLIETNFDEALRLAKGDLPPTAESNAVSQLLIDRFQNEGRFQDAIDIVEKTAAKATTQGQAIQALSMYSRLTPEGVLRYAQRVIDKAKQTSPGAKVKGLTPDLAEEIVTHARRLKGMPEGRGKIIETAKLLKKVHEQIPPSFLRKVSTAQTLMQLLNPKTAIRNLIGNLGFTAVENISDVVGAAFDKFLVSPITGQRAKMLPSFMTQTKGFLRGGKEAIEEIKQGVNIAPQTTQFDIPKTSVFKGGVGQKLERLLNYELRVPDRAFYQAAYDESLGNQMRAAKVQVPTDAMKEIAHFDGLYRTFQDPNVVSRSFQKIKDALNAGKEFGVGDLVLKYPRTPGALLARGIEYSPAGFFKTAVQLYRGIKRLPSFSQKSLVESAARSTVGTGIIGSGILLARLGIITGRKDESKGIRALKQELGLRDYQINADALGRFIASGFDPAEAKSRQGDKLLTYDWFQPQSINLAIGANIEENKGEPKGVVGVIADAIASGGETLTGQPLVQGVTRLFGYGDPVSGLGEVLKGVPASFVPTLLNQIRLLVDDVARNPEAESPVKESLNLMKMKIPEASKSLRPRLTPFGEEKRYRAGAGIERALNVFLNPAISSKYAESADADILRELVRLDVTIPEQGKTIRGLSISKDEQYDVARLAGPEVKQQLAQFIRSEYYSALNDEQKADRLESIIQRARQRKQREFLRAR